MVGDSSFMFMPQNESVLSTGAFSEPLSVEAAVADFMDHIHIHILPSGSLIFRFWCSVLC